MTKTTSPLLALLLVAAPAWSAEPKLYLLDHSHSTLMDKGQAVAILTEGIPAKVWKLYPAHQWGYFSEVEGGFTASKTCVVTARVTMIPRTVTMRAPLMRPHKIATAFDAIPGATPDQCKALARDKLKEAVQSVVASLVKT